MSDTQLGNSAVHDGPDVPAPYAREVAVVVSGLSSDRSNGLTAAEAASRLTRHGSNQIAAEEPPSVWAVALVQLREPMNLMLVAVPADGRIVRSATLEAQEAALTGESAPVAKDSSVLPSGEVALGDRANMLFQNTSVTRGTASMVVTATGMGTQMGQIAGMLTSVTRARSPLQRELDSLTKVLGIIEWVIGSSWRRQPRYRADDAVRSDAWGRAAYTSQGSEKADNRESRGQGR